MFESKPLAWRTWLGQGLLYALFALIIGYFSSAPSYRHLAPELALIKLSVTHHGKRATECVQRTPEQLAQLPPNMRAPMQCQRERSPLTVELELDGKLVYRHVAQPSGLSKDGAASVYQRLPLLAGEHRYAVRLKDDLRSSGFDFTREGSINLRPGQVLVIDFNAEKGGITLI
ncbi:MAG: hypothetical protein HY847_17085 [Betaproteobacteria bacterium]|nr:hypothetical protein [Betaproteobacteria bacterium]